MNNSKLKKGQVQLGETVGVTIVIIVLIFLGIVFWNKNSSGNISEIASQSHQLTTIEIANMVPELSEIKCYDMGVAQIKCVDYYKLRALNESIQTNNKIFLYYHDYFKNSKIIVRQVYPQQEVKDENGKIEKTDILTVIYDAKLRDQNKTLIISLPVTIRDEIKDTTSYGFIEVQGYYTNS